MKRAILCILVLKRNATNVNSMVILPNTVPLTFHDTKNGVDLMNLVTEEGEGGGKKSRGDEDAEGDLKSTREGRGHTVEARNTIENLAI